MKQLLFISISLFLFSCNKTKCYQCNITTLKTEQGNIYQSGVKAIDVCEKTEDEIREYERSNTINSGWMVTPGTNDTTYIQYICKCN